MKLPVNDHGKGMRTLSYSWRLTSRNPRRDTCRNCTTRSPA